jgi:hypothetical protein
LKHRSKEEIAALVLESNARTVKGIFGFFNGKGLNRIQQARANLYNYRERYAFLRGLQSAKPIAYKQHIEDHHLNRITNYRTYANVKPTR